MRVPCRWDYRLAHRRVTAADEAGEAAFECATVEQDVAGADRAAQTDVGTEPIDKPLVASAGVRAPEPNDVSKHQFDYARPIRR
jgi:hypothetical protein